MHKDSKEDMILPTLSEAQRRKEREIVAKEVYIYILVTGRKVGFPCVSLHTSIL